ncbi:hypothetical protein ACVMB2_005956 [Sinorhizobium meliloti]|nr:hypothetical protein SAMN04244576_04767 [Sinorhizobium meliloti]
MRIGSGGAKWHPLMTVMAGTGVSWKLAPTCLEDFPSCLDFAARRSGYYVFP